LGEITRIAEVEMPKYLVEVNYVGEGVKGLVKEGGSGRQAAAKNLFESLGGKMEAFYFAFGKRDAYVIGELPDNTAAAAMALAVNSAGLAMCKTTVLMTPDEVDTAVKKKADYRAPGK
jgi:uncharacterized protein with GYD domain